MSMVEVMRSITTQLYIAYPTSHHYPWLFNYGVIDKDTTRTRPVQALDTTKSSLGVADFIPRNFTAVEINKRWLCYIFPGVQTVEQRSGSCG